MRSAAFFFPTTCNIKRYVKINLGQILHISNSPPHQPLETTRTCIVHWRCRASSSRSKLQRHRPSPPGGVVQSEPVRSGCVGGRWAADRETYHGVDVRLFLSVVDGHQQGLLVVAAPHGRVEVHDVGVVVVVADVAVLPPARIRATIRS